MTPSIELDADRHYGIGPYPDTYGHGPITVFTVDPQDGNAFYACLDCGYVARDIRMFLHTECRREANPINQTWREFLADDDFPTTEDETPFDD